MSNEELKNKVSSLVEEVRRLRNELNSLKQSSGLAVEVVQTLERRDFISASDPQNPPAGAEIAGMGFKDEIGLTGLEQTITVLAEPTKYLRVLSKTIGGVPFYIPIYYL